MTKGKTRHARRITRGLAARAKRLIRRRAVHVSPVGWANLGPIAQHIADKTPPLHPPVLMLSMPRSGSSWVGASLALSNGAMYLAEPITQTYLSHITHGPGFLEIAPETMPAFYAKAARAAFAGIPAYYKRIVRHPQQWQLAHRANRRVVIKEVNPLMLDWILTEFSPRVVYLLRHPAPVANSFAALGWTGSQITSRISQETLRVRFPNHEEFTDSFWTEHGALQAYIMNNALQRLSDYSDSLIVEYEEICANPEETFRRLYEFCQLPWDSKIATQIQENSRATLPTASGQYTIQRNSAAMAEQWKSKMKAEEIAAVKRGFLTLSPPYYGESEWP